MIIETLAGIFTL